MSFFVTSEPAAADGNLGGLAGADAKCTALATAAGAGGKTWRAYLSIAGTNASTRIGTGPWYNQKLKVIGTSVATLHTAGIPAADVIDEKGVAPAANIHDIITGTNADGTANASTCNGWTSAAGNMTAFLGHSDSSGASKWNNAHNSQSCTGNGLTAGGGNRRIYCFAP